MRTKKDELEYFKQDPWPVRMGVLVIQYSFQLALVALLAIFSGNIVNLRTLWFLLKRFF